MRGYYTGNPMMHQTGSMWWGGEVGGIIALLLSLVLLIDLILVGLLLWKKLKREKK